MMNELKFSKKKQTGNKQIDAQQYKAITQNEASLQKQCEQLLDMMHLRYYRIPDAIWKFKGTTPATRAILSNYFKGLPDLTVLIPLDEIYCKAVCFELKTKKGKLTGGQKRFQRKLPLIIIRSFDQFQKELEVFLR